MESVVWIRLGTLLLSLVASVAVWAPLEYRQEHAESLAVHFLDVGQGDAILIETPDGVQVLVDGGRDGKVLTELAAIVGPFDRTLDMVVATHGDSDHVGGLSDVLGRYSVAQLLITENKGESDVAKAFYAAVDSEGAEITYARRGQEFLLGASTSLRVLYPETNPAQMESNASSIVLQLTYGEHSFLLTGDSPKRIEEYLVLTEGESLESDVLKVGHHGSHTSTAEDFLLTVDPQYAVISAGAENRYGHPHVEVTDMLFNQRVSTYSTAEWGRVSFYSNGTELIVE